MLGKQVKGKDFYGVLKYNQNKVDNHEAIILDTNLSSKSVIKQTKELNIVRQQKPNLSKAVYHVSLNLPYNDTNKLSNNEFSNLARDYLEGMGFEDNQYIVYKHFDVDHSHIHIVANRVKFSGDVVSDSQDYKRSEVLIRKLERSYNLSELIRKEESNILSKGEIEKCLRTGDVPDRLELQNIIIDVLKRKIMLSEFIEKLKMKGVNVKINQSLTTGFISGISFEYKSVSYKGSKVHKSLSWNNIKAKVNYEQIGDNYTISTSDSRVGKNESETNRVIAADSRIRKETSAQPEFDLEKSQREISNKPKFRFKI
jgi:hypothetical protein